MVIDITAGTNTINFVNIATLEMPKILEMLLMQDGMHRSCIKYCKRTIYGCRCWSIYTL